MIVQGKSDSEPAMVKHHQQYADGALEQDTLIWARNERVASMYKESSED